LSNKNTNKIAIISGTGILPQLLSEELLKKELDHLVVHFNSAAPNWISQNISIIEAKIEQIAKLFDQLKLQHVNRVVFAGASVRPKIDLQLADKRFLSLAPDIMRAMKAGDDTILRLLVTIFENEGFKVIGSQDILPFLLPSAGVLTKRQPSDQDERDIVRAREIVQKMGDVDVGQACVVSNGMCLGVETIQGTQEMLKFVKSFLDSNKSNKGYRDGVFFKNIKANQSRLIDFPVIGPETVKQVSDANLNGIAIVYNNVFILDLFETINMANDKNIFISVIAE